jgi:hypothetical protein
MSTLRILDQPAKTCGPEPSECEACGQNFNCGAALAGCWCVEIKLSDAARQELRTRYQRCLCRACLESFANNTQRDI